MGMVASLSFSRIPCNVLAGVLLVIDQLFDDQETD